MQSRSALVLSILVAAPLSGCFFGPSPGASGAAPTGAGAGAAGAGSTGSTGGAGGGPAQTTKDLAQYDAMQAALEKSRTMWKPAGVSALTSVDTRVFWLAFATANPTVQSFDTVANQEIDYTFSIGGQCDYNFRASENLVVYADLNGGYYAYDVTKPNTPVGTLNITPPSSGVKWWSYAPDHGDVYIVTEGPPTTLWKWTPPAAMPVMLFNLEDTGATIGEFLDFGVSGNTMVFIESGAVWSLDIAAKKSTSLGNMIQDTTGAEIDADGVLFPTDMGADFYSNATMKLRDLAAAIQASSYMLNGTFPMAHDYDTSRGGLGRYANRVLYTGSSGIFTFALDTGAIAPVLLDARDNSTYYGQFTVTSNGLLFVQGLQSNDGAIGADGPTYEVKLAP